MQKPKISILGCGWLGFPLAEKLWEYGFSVNGSTTSEKKMTVLEKANIPPFLISVSEKGITGNIAAFLGHSDILIIDIPPKLRGENRENFVAKIKILLPFIENSTVGKVLFVSSTAVFADDDSIITEDTFPNPDAENGKQLTQAEKLLQHNPNFKTTILRFGGLIGGDRHPVKFLSGKENLENPDAPVNLIHQKDCIGIILKIIESDSWNETFNAAFPSHPSREAYYVSKAMAFGLPLPIFSHEQPSIGKTIDSQKIIETLGYHFCEPI